jgi:hypothetical protein
MTLQLRNRLCLAGAFALFLALPACNDDQPSRRTIDPHEHAVASPVDTAQTVLEKTFTLKKSATFPFEIPAHAVRPHLHGIFEAFAQDAAGVSDDAGNIDFLILNEEQQAEVLANHPTEAVFSVEGTHSQAVNYDLPPAFDQPAKYYLVFRNSDTGKSSKVVRASFRVDF